jgi:hypothetical protein
VVLLVADLDGASTELEKTPYQYVDRIIELGHHDATMAMPGLHQGPNAP